MSKLYKKYIQSNKKDILIICIGSTKYVGDNLGPLVGTRLMNLNLPYIILGTMTNPVNALNYKYNYNKIDKDKYFIIAIDAAVGTNINKISYKNKLYPGYGVNKKLKEIGDIAITAVTTNDEGDIYKNLENVSQMRVFNLASIILKEILEFHNLLYTNHKK